VLTQTIHKSSLFSQYIGTEDFEGIACYNFRLKVTMGKKVNVYTLTVDQANKVPKRYEMLGYDTLFGSHYDKYEVLYTHFDNTAPTEETFKIPEGIRSHIKNWVK
jgi:hypothetical protein